MDTTHDAGLGRRRTVSGPRPADQAHRGDRAHLACRTRRKIVPPDVVRGVIARPVVADGRRWVADVMSQTELGPQTPRAPTDPAPPRAHGHSPVPTTASHKSLHTAIMKYERQRARDGEPSSREPLGDPGDHTTKASPLSCSAHQCRLPVSLAGRSVDLAAQCPRSQTTARLTRKQLIDSHERCGRHRWRRRKRSDRCGVPRDGRLGSMSRPTTVGRAGVVHRNTESD